MEERESVRVAKASFDRCSAAPDFLTAFYRHFFVACPEAKPLFAKTDLERQVKLLRDAIGLLLIAPFFPPEPNAESLLSRIAEQHSRRHLGVEPRFYPPFVDSLIATVAAFDPEYGPAVESAWRTAIARGVAYMQSRY